MKKFKTELIFSGFILLIFGILVYLETNLPFFKKFLPISENKLIIVILNINLLLILLLLFLVSRTLVKTYIEQKRGIWGARLKTKLTVTLKCHFNNSLFYSLHPFWRVFSEKYGQMVWPKNRGYS